MQTKATNVYNLELFAEELTGDLSLLGAEELGDVKSATFCFSTVGTASTAGCYMTYSTYGCCC